MGFHELDGKTWSQRTTPSVFQAICDMKYREECHALIKVAGLEYCQRRYYAEIECRISATIRPYNIKFINGFVEVYIKK